MLKLPLCYGIYLHKMFCFQKQYVKSDWPTTQLFTHLILGMFTLSSASCSFLLCQEDKGVLWESKEEISFIYNCCTSLQRKGRWSWRKQLPWSLLALKYVMFFQCLPIHGFVFLLLLEFNFMTTPPVITTLCLHHLHSIMYTMGWLQHMSIE